MCLLSSHSGPYLIVATQRKLLGKIENQEIFMIKQFEVIPFVKSNYHLSETQASPSY